MNDRILLLVEGQDEYVFFQRMGEVTFGDKTLDIVTLRCNIYSLYKTMKSYDFMIDLEKAILFSPNLAEVEKEKIVNVTFPFKYLVFDFDFQEKAMESEEKIDALEKMVSFFNDDSDQGLLLLNYPMFESFREKIQSDALSNIKFDPLSSVSYKTLIDERGNKVDSGKLGRTNFLDFATKSLCLSNYIFKGVFEKPSVLDLDFSSRLFDKQKEKLLQEDVVYCINTSVLLPCFYFGLNVLK